MSDTDHRGHLGRDMHLLHLRMRAAGLDEADLRAVQREAKDWASWSQALAGLGRRCAGAAEAAAEAGRADEASTLWRRATACHHFASLYQEGDTGARHRGAARAAYACLGVGLDPPCRRVTIPFGDGALPGYVRDPGSGAGWVVIVGALDMGKEVEGHLFAEAFVECGIAVVAFDGPGQGELTGETTMAADYEAAVGAVLDFLAVDAGVDRVGLFGASLGGYLAVRAATMDPRVAACVSLCGPVDLQPVRRMATWIQRETARMFGVDSVAPLVDVDGPYRLAALPRSLDCPTVVVQATDDHFVSPEHARHLQEWAAPDAVQIWPCAGAEHCCFSRLPEVLPRLADWMAQHVQRPAAVPSPRS